MPTALRFASSRDRPARYWRYTRQTGKALTKNGQRLSGLSRIWSDADRFVIDAQRFAEPVCASVRTIKI